ncbi:MAG: TolC family protein [Bacteroidetes bacterium]|uniref:TolC family protein n=1 Tax=Candidatus Cryptobacteroides merdigallinarum TaxID=2840770 RepID=A0A9D9ELP1_9BACT|nr:TolC family protein [Candidatus Cryptobacteroides merdigallinarum]
MKTVSEIKGCNKQKNFYADRLAVLLSLWISMATFPGEILAQQTSEMTLEQVIDVARSNSVAAIEAKASFVSDYWAYRSYKASRLPSLNLYGNLASFDRSLRQLQNYETGELVYTSNYNMQNSLGLSVVQNLPFTGGTVSLYTDLSRIDQFGADFGKTWYAQPVTFEYEQPLLSYNSFKWEKKISPKKYEYAKRAYIESMEQVTIDAVTCYFDLMLARKAHDTAVSNYRNTMQMFSVAAQRLVLGSVTKDEYLQLELRMLNDSISINETAVKVKEAQMQMNSLLGYDERMEIIPVAEPHLPDIWMDYDMVMEKAIKNSSFRLDNEIKTLTAESDIARAKADRGASVSFRAKFGLSNSDAAFRETYKNLVDQEVVGITFSIPIFDWGLGRGRVKEAEAQAEAVEAQVEQAENDYRRQVYTAVGQFNSQRQQCMASERASRVARERYSLVMDRFRRGTASVMELNTAQSECDTATEKYIGDLSSYWSYYYAIRQLTLFDFIEGKDIEVDFEELIK